METWYALYTKGDYPESAYLLDQTSRVCKIPQAQHVDIARAGPRGKYPGVTPGLLFVNM